MSNAVLPFEVHQYFTFHLTHKEDKLELPEYNPATMSFQTWYAEVFIALQHKKLAYLLQEPCTTPANADDSMVLALEIFDKIRGAAITTFDNLDFEGKFFHSSWGIDMLKVLANKFRAL